MISSTKPLIQSVDLPRDSIEIINISNAKLQKVRLWMDENQLDALLISNRDDFAWVTTGANGALIESGSNCVACLAITKDDKFLCGHPMDTGRLLEEQIPGQEYQVLEGKWFQGSPQSIALSRLQGRIATDIPLPGTGCHLVDLHHLHYPLSDLEMDRLRWLGAAVNDIFIHLADAIKPGMSEQQLAKILRRMEDDLDIHPAVTIVGSDERVFRHRHPLPTNKRIDKFIMVHTGPRRWGLHAPITRNYHFGQPDKELQDAFAIIAKLQTNTFSLTKPGIPYSAIQKADKELYAQLDVAEEWEAHYHGGPTGYRIVNPLLGMTNAVVRKGTAYEWFSTIPGVKIAELTLLTENGLEIASSYEDAWPKHTTEINNFKAVLPAIKIL